MSEYTVRKGDTLTGIARHFHVSLEELLHVNPEIKDRDVIYIDEHLKIPTRAGAVRRPPSRPAPKAVKRPAVKPAVNPLVEAAVRRAKRPQSLPKDRCDEAVASYWGYSSSGYASAYINWQNTPRQHRHAGDRNPPAGASLSWADKGGGYGHEAFSLGHGLIVTTDMNSRGQYTPGHNGIVPLGYIERFWGLVYLGATDPYFQGHLVTKVY